ncbi:MAG: multidrug effflux MFS transporter [Sphingomonadaceae bacterium]|nr:multidrug effflux MFS transporter [Sphingomonadaceae bacterium]
MTELAGKSQNFPMKEFEFTGLMAAMMALQALAIDVMLPALGIIAQDLGAADPNDRQLVVGVFLVSSGVFALFPGPLADRFGRRPVALTCLAAYFVICLASAFVTDFSTLLMLRVMLGMFSAGLMTLPLAVVRDRFSGDRMARAQSMIAMIFMLVPMLAPLLGQGIMVVSGWREIFVVMAFLGLMVGVWVWFRLPETLHSDYRQPIRPKVILSNMWLAISLRQTVGYVLGGIFVQAAILGYINISQQLIAEALGAGEWFPTVFGAMAAMIALANFINSRIVERFGARRVSHTALLASIVVAVIHAAIAWRGGETLLVFAVLMGLSMFANSFLGANFQSIALQPFARIAGSAASAMSSIRLVGGATIGLLIGQAYDGSPLPLALSLVGIGLAGLALVLFSENGQLFKQRNVPEQG